MRFLSSTRWLRLALILVAAAASPAAISGNRGIGGPSPERSRKMIGMYVHQHWPYNHPYCARTWTIEDWRGYADGLKRLGFNTILIWPMLEIRPNPLTPSDRSNLEKIGRVIDMLHQMQMGAYLVLCPNIVCNHSAAARAPFEKRHYFFCEERVNPADAAALKAMIDWRETLLRPLAHADGIAMIDSDPGGYPGSTNSDFVQLLAEHRKMLDRLRPGCPRERAIELIYWMHAGWRGWSHLYEVGKISFSTPEEQEDVLRRLIAVNPEPWGLANGLDYAKKLGVAEKVISFNYGRIEGEPSFPMTNFGGTTAYEGARSDAPRGVMGNAQTHCVQLPNTFAFARGATGQPLAESDYLRFAEDLVPGHGERILAGWKAIGGHDAAAMSTAADDLQRLANSKPAGGPLKGLLFGSPERFLTDLVLMLRQRAATEQFAAGVNAGRNAKQSLSRLVMAVTHWQQRHGYECNWYDPLMRPALQKLNAPAINEVLSITYEAKPPFGPGRTPADQIRANFRAVESFTPRLIAAMKQTAENMR